MRFHFMRVFCEQNYVISGPECLIPGGGGTPIETLYGDVPPKWVGFWQKNP